MVMAGDSCNDGLKSSSAGEKGNVMEKDHLWTHLNKQNQIKSLGDHAAGVTHETNNALEAILNNLTVLSEYVGSMEKVIESYQALLLRKTDLSSEEISGLVEEISQKEGLEEILSDMPDLISESIEGTRKIRDTVVGLKNFTQIHGEQKKEFNINEAVEAMLLTLKNDLNFTGHITKNLQEVPGVQCSPGEIAHALLNLLRNAAETLPKQGEITVETHANDVEVEIRISEKDNGTAVKKLGDTSQPPEPLPEKENFDLRFHLSYGIVQKNHGTLHVKSDSEEGSIFTIRLPIAQPQEI
jgi:signal transduction histidine kinase